MTDIDISPEAVERMSQIISTVDARSGFANQYLDNAANMLDALRSALTAANEYGQLKASQLNDEVTERRRLELSLTAEAERTARIKERVRYFLSLYRTYDADSTEVFRMIEAELAKGETP